MGVALRAPGRLYDWHLGWLLGHRFLRLTHRGRRTGRIHTTMLEVVRYDAGVEEFVVLAALGRRADWYRNIMAAPALEVAVGHTRFRPIQRVLADDEAAADLAAYERRTRLIAPLVRSVLSGLVGWRYDGSAQARARFVAQRPMVGFRRAVASDG